MCAASSRVWPARTLRVLVRHKRHHPAAAKVTQLLRAAISAAWCTACHAHATLPPPAPTTRAGSRHWQPGGLLKKRLDSSAKAMEYKPQKPDPALAGAQAHAPGRQRPSWPLFREPPDALAPKATHGPRPPPLRTIGAASASSSVAAGRPTPGGHCLPFAQILKYGYKKSLIRTKEGEVKWVPTKKLPSSSFASSACVVL